jgi:hypothetical protein
MEDNSKTFHFAGLGSPAYQIRIGCPTDEALGKQIRLAGPID